MEQYFTYQHKQVSYKQMGHSNNTTILFIHGFAEDYTVFTHQANYLQAQYHVVLINLPGSGHSAFNEALLSIADYADVVYALIQHIGISKLVLLGHSMGGYVTLAFAKKYSKYLLGFGLIHSTAYSDSDEKKQIRLKGISFMQQYGMAAFVKATLPNLFSSSLVHTFHEYIQQQINQYESVNPEPFIQYYKAMMQREDSTAILATSPVPVLFIIGTEDVAVTKHDALQQCYLPNISYVCLLQHVGHMGMLEAPEQVNAAIHKFITTLKQ